MSARGRRKLLTAVTCVAVTASLLALSACAPEEEPATQELSEQETTLLLSELEKRGFDDPVMIKKLDDGNALFTGSIQGCRLTIIWKQSRFFVGDYFDVNASMLAELDDFARFCGN